MMISCNNARTLSFTPLFCTLTARRESLSGGCSPRRVESLQRSPLRGVLLGDLGLGALR